MRAACWYGKHDVRVKYVPDPEIVNPRDAIVRVTLSAVCGTDLHAYNGLMAGMKKGKILGHEFLGEIVEVGSAITNLKPGDRVVVACTIACGSCWHCKRSEFSACDNSNPAAAAVAQQKLNGASCAGVYGLSELYGGYDGGQSQYVRVPYADVGCLPINGHRDEQVLFLSDILPTAYMAAENAEIEAGDTVCVFGCGPVGQLAILSARLLGASRVIAVDDVGARLSMAELHGGAEVVDASQGDPVEAIRELTGGRGADSCIDAVGTEAHGHGLGDVYDKVKQRLHLTQDRPTALRHAILACRKEGTVSVIGVYMGMSDKIPLGAVFAKGLTLRTGQVHAPKYMRPLLARIENGDIDPSFLITHRVTLDELPAAYQKFNDKQDGCVKVVVRPS